MQQGTLEWKMARLGKVTASKINDVVAKIKNGDPSALRATYMGKLIAERLTGMPATEYVSPEMQWGTEKEPEARAAYEFMTDATVELIGFVDHPRITLCGASPDGLIGDDGLIEIKCPNTSTHIDTLLDASIDAKYVKQMQWQMAVTGRKWADFVSYDPRMPAEMQLFIKRVERDDTMIRDLESEVRMFLRDMDEKITALQEKHGMIVRALVESAMA